MIIDLPIEYDIEYVPQGKRKPIIQRIEDTFPFDLNIMEHDHINLYAEIKEKDDNRKKNQNMTIYEKDNSCYKKVDFPPKDTEEILDMLGYRKNFHVDPYNQRSKKSLKITALEDIKKIISTNQEEVIQSSTSFLKSKLGIFLKIHDDYYKRTERPLLNVSLGSFGFADHIMLDLNTDFHYKDNMFSFPLELKDELLIMVKQFSQENDIKCIIYNYDIKLHQHMSFQDVFQDTLTHILNNIPKDYKNWDIFEYNDEQMLSFLQLRKLRDDLENNISTDNVIFFMDYLKKYIDDLKSSNNKTAIPYFRNYNFFQEQLKIISNHDIKNTCEITQKT